MAAPRIPGSAAAALMRTRCPRCVFSVGFYCSGGAFSSRLFSFFLLLVVGFACGTALRSQHAEAGQPFHFFLLEGFICFYSCSRPHSAWSNVWVRNVLPETAGRVSARLRVCVCVCVCVCDVSMCPYKKRRQRTLGGAGDVVVEDWRAEWGHRRLVEFNPTGLRRMSVRRRANTQ